MTEQTMKDSLNDLRDDSKNSNNELLFRKRLFGGYKEKEVAEYIQILKENLENAEASFREKLEEYAAMATMLEQERDKYMNMYKESGERNYEIQERVNTLSIENEELSIKLQDIKDEMLLQDDRPEHKSAASENEEIEKERDAYKEYNQDNIELKEQFNQLKLTVQDLNAQIKDYEENKETEETYDIIRAENEIIKEKYEEIVYENSISVAEKESLMEQNKRMSDSLIEVNEKNKELRNTITSSKLKTRKMIVEFEARAYECAQNHRKNIDQITENIKSTLNILHYENEDIANLINSPFGEFELETEDVENELESAALPLDELGDIVAFTASMEKKLLSKAKKW